MSLPKNNPDSSRRSFLATAAVAASAALVGLRPHSAQAAGENLPHLSESDPLAKSLGYQSDGKNVDKSKFPTYKAGERCGVSASSRVPRDRLPATAAARYSPATR